MNVNTRPNAPKALGIAQAAFVAVIALALTGCETAPPSNTAHAAPLPPIEAKGAKEPATTPKQSAALPKATPSPAPQPAPRQPGLSPAARRTEPKPAPTIANKDAEKLPAPHAPVTGVVLGKPATKPKAVESQPRVAQVSDAGTSAPVAELIVKGPPHPEQPKFGAKKAVMLIGLGLTGAVLAIVACLYVVRRPQPVEVPKGKAIDPMRADGLLMKEPLEQP